jgi:hypothetical protein
MADIDRLATDQGCELHLFDGEVVHVSAKFCPRPLPRSTRFPSRAYGMSGIEMVFGVVSGDNHVM